MRDGPGILWYVPPSPLWQALQWDKGRRCQQINSAAHG